MTNISIYLLAILLVLTSFDSPNTKKTKWLEGTWIGTGYEPDIQAHWETKLDFNLNEPIFRISYPSFPCSGTWRLLEANKTQAKFIEYITENAELCQNEGTVIVTKINDEFISVAYFLPEYSDDVIGFTVLRKVNDSL